MAHAARTNSSLAELLGDPPAVYWTTRYLKRLLIERHAIRARLENPGGSIILMGSELVDQQSSYSPVIGNDFHLDLMDAEDEVTELSVGDRMALLHWLKELTPAQTADYLSARGPVKLRSVQRHAERKAGAIVETLSARQDT